MAGFVILQKGKKLFVRQAGLIKDCRQSLAVKIVAMVGNSYSPCRVGAMLQGYVAPFLVMHVEAGFLEGCYHLAGS
jgi:hypothetical protein